MEVTVLDADFSVDPNGTDIANEYLYTGRRLDPETHLQINRNRFYASHLGRWVNRDPIGYEGGKSLNLYQYVGSMPTYFVDPTGEYALWPPSQWWPWGDPGPPKPPEPFPIMPVIGPMLPPGLGETIGATEAAPGSIRIGDMTKKRRKLMEDVMDDDAFNESEDCKTALSDL